MAGKEEDNILEEDFRSPQHQSKDTGETRDTPHKEAVTKLSKFWQTPAPKTGPPSPLVSNQKDKINYLNRVEIQLTQEFHDFFA